MPGAQLRFTAVPVPLTDLSTAPVFLQTGFWGTFKGQHGWEPRAFRVDVLASHPDAEVPVQAETFTLLVLLRQVRRGLVLAYVPHGPTASAFFPLPSTGSSGELEKRLEALATALQPQLPTSVFALRFDLLSGTSFVPLAKDEEDDGAATGSDEPFPLPLARPFVKPAADVQPPDTVVLDLKPTLDEILGRMKKKTRYNIRLAEKKGVVVKEGTLADLEAWYALYEETSRRDKIALHSFNYYKSLFELSAADPAAQAPRVHLLLAFFEGKLLAGNVVLVHRTQGVYLYGASSNEHRNLMAPYALQLKGIELCKAAGCETYDLFGIPPTNDPTHPMHGLYRFKTGFGGTIEHRHGAWDLRFKPLAWNLVNTADKLRVWYFKKWKKR